MNLHLQIKQKQSSCVGPYVPPALVYGFLVQIDGYGPVTHFTSDCFSCGGIGV